MPSKVTRQVTSSEGFSEGFSESAGLSIFIAFLTFLAEFGQAC